MKSQPLDTVEAIIRQLSGLRGELKLDPPVLVDFSVVDDGVKDENGFLVIDTIALEVREA